MRLTVIASGSAGNCYVLEGKSSALILECGASPERVMTGSTLDFSKVAGCLVTHEHGDHAAYVQRFAELGLRIYASAGTIDALKLDKNAVVVLTPNYGRPVGEFLVQPFRTSHDAAEPLGFIITHQEMGKLLFLTDTREIPYNFKRQQLDHIMVEANYDDGIMFERLCAGELAQAQATRVRASHLSIREAIALVKANETARLKTVTLLHLSEGNADGRDFQLRMQDAVLFADVKVARPGFTMPLRKEALL